VERELKERRHGERDLLEHHHDGNVLDDHLSIDHAMDVKSVHHHDVSVMQEHRHDERDLLVHRHDGVMVGGNQIHRGVRVERVLDDRLRNDRGRHECRKAFRHPYVVVFRKDSKRQFRAWQHVVPRLGSLTLEHHRRKQCEERVILAHLHREPEPWSLLHPCP
jgi:hypothetical protein